MLSFRERRRPRRQQRRHRPGQRHRSATRACALAGSDAAAARRGRRRRRRARARCSKPAARASWSPTARWPRPIALVQRHARAGAAAPTSRWRRRRSTPCRGRFDVVVNATASSLAGGDVPVAGRVLKPGALALDMMYGPAAAGFMDWARAHGAVPRDGLGMLVEQAAEAFEIWRGVRPPTAPGAGRTARHRRRAAVKAASALARLPADRGLRAAAVLRRAHRGDGGHRSRSPRPSSAPRPGGSRARPRNGERDWQQRWVPYAQISDYAQARRDRRARTASSSTTRAWSGRRSRSARQRNAKAEEIAARRAAQMRARGKEPRAGAKMRGGSTITQQLAKNLLLSGERTLLRKGQELVLATALEAAAEQGAHPGDLPQQRRMGRRRVRRRSGRAALLQEAARRASAPTRRRGWR